MSRVVLVDAGPLGMLTHPRPNREILRWLRHLRRAGAFAMVPEIADYEVRRELLRIDSRISLGRLDTLKATIGYIPITTATMLKAAEFWADARRRGRPTAPDLALDGDVILAAQAFEMASQGHDTVIATTNVRHLEQYASAQKWEEIR
jgi:predicted nucleic acid-binding protein